jgi:hypothetical protein
VAAMLGVSFIVDGMVVHRHLPSFVSVAFHFVGALEESFRDRCSFGAPWALVTRVLLLHVMGLRVLPRRHHKVSDVAGSSN